MTLCREYVTYEEVVADYGSGALHPGDLKPALAKALNAILQPVRDHFATDERAKKLLAQVLHALHCSRLLSCHPAAVSWQCISGVFCSRVQQGAGWLQR